MTVLDGFERRIGCDGSLYRVAGRGPAAVLIHGYPQTAACWDAVARVLAAERTVYAVDAPGYGASPATADQSKRAAAERLVREMAAFGVDRFDVVGHDRGGRIAYRMALDHPRAVRRIATLDITPTIELWDAFDASAALDAYHWTFLAQPAPLPERMIGADPVGYLDWTLASWTAAGDLSAFSPAALAEYRAAFARPEAIAAACADYRAGATLDRAADAEDRAAGRKIAAPLLALWSETGFARGAETPLAVWRRWADRVDGRPIRGAGHFLPEEAPAETAAALQAFLEVG